MLIVGKKNSQKTYSIYQVQVRWSSLGKEGFFKQWCYVCSTGLWVADTVRALLGLFICRVTLGMAAMPVKSVNKHRAEQLWDVFRDRTWNTEGRTWKLEVTGEEEQGCWLCIQLQCWGWEWKLPLKCRSFRGHGPELLLSACGNTIVEDKENHPIYLGNLLYILSSLVLDGDRLIFVYTIGYTLQCHNSSLSTHLISFLIFFFVLNCTSIFVVIPVLTAFQVFLCRKTMAHGKTILIMLFFFFFTVLFNYFHQFVLIFTAEVPPALALVWSVFKSQTVWLVYIRWKLSNEKNKEKILTSVT